MVALEDFVESFRARCRVVNAVDVMIGIIVKVMVFQKQMAPRDKTDVPVEMGTDEHSTGVVVSGLQFLGYFQRHAATASNVPIDADDPEWLKMTYDERVLIPDYEMMLAQSPVVDVLVVVPGVPIMGVVSRRNFSSA